jgi:hypothetical protein
MCPLLVVILEMTEVGSPVRAKAMTAAIEAGERVRAILAATRLN